ncbi:MAG: hypothetical protein U0992_24550 [Planctomycetaceae bacterium]
MGLAGSSLVLLLIGIIDDLVGPARPSKAGRIVAVSRHPYGVRLASSIASCCSGFIDLGLLNVPFTLLWLLGAINAVNLLMNQRVGSDVGNHLGGGAGPDVPDRRASGGGDRRSGALAGSLLGFLRYNFPKATVFPSVTPGAC